MAYKRSVGQRMIPVMMTSELVEHIDKHLTGLNYSDRAKFIRDAIGEKLKAMGFQVPDEWLLAPSRLGKGQGPSASAASRAALTDAKTSILKEAKRRQSKTTGS